MCQGPHPFIPVDNVARFRLNLIHNGELCMNVIHVRLGTSWAQTDLENMAQILASWWNTNIKGLVNPATSLQSVEATSLETEDDLRIVYTLGLPSPGTNAGPPLPGATTVAVRLTSAFSGRSRNGRLYHIGLVESQVLGNALEVSARPVLIAAYEELLVAISEYGNNASLVIVSYCNNGVWRTTGAATDVESATIDQYIDSQRRRNHR